MVSLIAEEDLGALEEFSSKISDIFDETSLRSLEQEIANHDGQEILFGGNLNALGQVSALTVLSLGTNEMVAVITADAQAYDVIVHNHPSQSLKPSPEDLYAAGVLGEHGVGFYIVSNDATQVHVVVRCQKKSGEDPQAPSTIDVEAIAELLISGKTIRELLPEYVSRSSQQKMLKGVASAFNQKEIYLCESPTGTGKSLAYLLPALIWAHQHKKRIVISTNTIALQNQLLASDIPLAQKITGTENLRVELVKGRSNYLCHRKFAENFNQEAVLFDHDDPAFMALQRWGQDTETGDFLEFRARDAGETAFKRYREQIVCDQYTCKDSTCKYRSLKKCFYSLARTRQSQADVLVVNHATLIIDLAIKSQQQSKEQRGVLPYFERLIIDEGHHLEDVALNHLGKEASRQAISSTLRNIFSLNKPPKSASGVIPKLRRWLDTQEKIDAREGDGVEGTSLLTDWAPYDKIIRSAINDFREREKELFAEIFNSLRYAQTPGASQNEANRVHLRIKPSVLDENYWKPLSKAVAEIIEYLEDIEAALAKGFKYCSQIKDLSEDSILQDYEGYRSRLRELAEAFHEILKPEAPAEVKWIEANRYQAGFNVTVKQVPLDVGERLKDILWASMKTVVLTSATLTTGKSFDFLCARFGLSAKKTSRENERAQDQGKQDIGKRLRTERMESHFQYKDHCGFFVPSAPFPEQPDQGAFLPHARELILNVTRFLGGRTLILFTAYGTMQQFAGQLSSPLREAGIGLMVQREHEPAHMVRTLKTNPQTVLMGVDSLWEGIDIRGDHLSCVIMMKLPFPNPKDPIIEAQTDYVNGLGLHWFRDFSLPKAILKYRQGFGRLIRGEAERGLFILLDRRVQNKPYGKTFEKSLPPVRMLRETDALSAAEKFFA